MPKRQQDQDLLPFQGGPRDGDRIIVRGQPVVFETPVPFTAGKGKKQRSYVARYELRDGTYHYAGQIEKKLYGRRK